MAKEGTPGVENEGGQGARFALMSKSQVVDLWSEYQDQARWVGGELLFPNLKDPEVAEQELELDIRASEDLRVIKAAYVDQKYISDEHIVETETAITFFATDSRGRVVRAERFQRVPEDLGEEEIADGSNEERFIDSKSNRWEISLTSEFIYFQTQDGVEAALEAVYQCYPGEDGKSQLAIWAEYIYVGDDTITHLGSEDRVAYASMGIETNSKGTELEYELMVRGFDVPWMNEVGGDAKVKVTIDELKMFTGPNIDQLRLVEEYIYGPMSKDGEYLGRFQVLRSLQDRTLQVSFEERPGVVDGEASRFVMELVNFDLRTLTDWIPRDGVESFKGEDDGGKMKLGIRLLVDEEGRIVDFDRGEDDEEEITLGSQGEADLRPHIFYNGQWLVAEVMSHTQVMFYHPVKVVNSKGWTTGLVARFVGGYHEANTILVLMEGGFELSRVRILDEQAIGRREIPVTVVIGLDGRNRLTSFVCN